MVKKLLIIIGVLVLGAGIYFWCIPEFNLLTPKGEGSDNIERKLEKYDFDSLRKRGGKNSTISFEGSIKEVDDRRDNLNKNLKKTKQPLKEINFKSQKFSYVTDGKKMTGMMNYFADGQKHPAIIMIRGYADKEGYYTGSGSWKAADELARNGFVTASIDFLGFGGSDGESLDMLEARFEKVNGVLDLIESIKQLDFVDPQKIGIWAHSNGGQIALSVLEVTGSKFPTALWAPMTNPFPQSVLDTASGLDDGGKSVISAIENFTKEYDVRKYAFENYYQWVNGPVLIHQGTADEWCKVEWQREVVEKLLSLSKPAELKIYPGDDHNLKNNWDRVVAEDISFFRQNLIK